MPIELVVVDAFTGAAFHGNPAAIAVLDQFPSESMMRDIAMEMNLSETAYAVRRSDGDFDLRWFTPTVEIDLCGHATLAAAHVIGTDVRFHTRSGVLSCTIKNDGWIAMDFPSDRPTPATPPKWFELDAMLWFGTARMGVVIELENAALVHNFVPDLAVLARLSKEAVIVTARAVDEEVDFVSRVFGPSIGIAEDPVTGAAHCVLAEYWGERLGKKELIGGQVSARGGLVKMKRLGERVELSGQAVSVAKVALLV